MDNQLVSTGELARRIGRSQTGARRLVAAGVIPPGIAILGSGKFVWRESDLPAIVAAVRERDKRRQRRPEQAAA